MNVALLSRPVADDHRLSRLCNMGFQLACAALAPDLLYDAQRSATPPCWISLNASPSRPLPIWKRICPIIGPHGSWLRPVKHVSRRPSSEPISTPGAPNLALSLHDKWNRLAPDGAISAPASHPELWQQIEARVTMAARREG